MLFSARRRDAILSSGFVLYVSIFNDCYDLLRLYHRLVLIDLNREDGTADILNGTVKGPSYTAPTTGTHKLGPKANQGAINAGLRALDRSGKPCRKWQKSSFKIRSFTGTEWEIPRWAAPPKVTIKGEPDESSSASSSKENKESTHVDSEKSNSAMDIEMGSTASMPPSSPAPIIVASA